jgi:cytochrome b involved in lipid metabolism
MNSDMLLKSLTELQDLCDREKKRYVAFEGKVLDVTEFSHPGPVNLITDNVGKDITEVYH